MNSAKRVMNGTFGEVWLDSEYVGECYKFQAKETYTRERVAMAGKLTAGNKLTGIERTGSMSLHKVNSRMAQKIGNQVRAGNDPTFTIISKLDDPDAYGAERVSILGVKFDDLTIADWERATLGMIEAPFTFEEYEYLDEVSPE